MISLIFIIPGLLAAYFLFIRPLLERLPAFKAFYAEADGFWAKVWAICGKSITMVWGAVLTGVGTLFQYLDPIATALGDPDLKSQIMEALKSNPQYLAYALMGISAITIASRLRSIGKVS